MSPRILIVEDEEDNLILINHILTYMLGFEEVYIARDGHEAIQQAYRYKPHLILMDLTLPKLSGWEATRSLKSDNKLDDTIIVALTAHAMVGDREKALAAGCDDYYPKPVNVDTFIQLISKYIDDTKISVSE